MKPRDLAEKLEKLPHVKEARWIPDPEFAGTEHWSTIGVLEVVSVDGPLGKYAARHEFPAARVLRGLVPHYPDDELRSIAWMIVHGITHNMTRDALT